MAGTHLDPALVHARMERMYRPQRHIYDLTRRWYLLGRDRLLDALKTQRRGFAVRGFAVLDGTEAD